MARALPTMFDSLEAASTARTRPGVAKTYYFDANISWDVSEHLTVRAGILNIGNKQPQYFATAPEATDTALYDILGRRFNFGASYKF